MSELQISHYSTNEWQLILQEMQAIVRSQTFHRKHSPSW